MTSERRAALSALLVASSRLVRIAAQATGNRTPSAVWRALGVLESEGPMRVGELAAAVRVTQPGMTRALGQMVEEELVSRIADTADSRAWLIRITERGAAALEAYRVEIGAALEPYFRDLDDADWRVLERASQLMAVRTTAEKEKVS
ncbi:MarR family winged helix-turn-helix transcriptional regulator [Pseudolysinimonas sp.]|uniref:MarR family winged helix-turn-helix transcriptional regulator n=1 Tax=Pseudolysinimonas sp. TaxID=2680009 RepID=UPI003F7E101E